MYLALFTRTSHLTFGRDMAQFKQLITFLTALSLALWACVLVSFAARVVLCHIWYRRRESLPPNRLPPP